MIMLRTSSSHRRQPLLQASRGGSQKMVTQLGEAVGGATAVFCCCPCGLANIVYLAIFKLPASLWRRALRLQKQQQRNRQRLACKEGIYHVRRRGCDCGCGDDYGAKVHPGGDVDEVVKNVKGFGFKVEEDKDVMELEKEMWERFYSTGFWRSCSRREDSSSSLSSSSSFSSLSSSSPQRIISIVPVSNLQVHDA